MSGRDELTLDETRRWFRYAREDMDAARFLWTANPNVPRHACWLSQQAVEKALKAALLYEEEDIEYTHDLEGLAILLLESWAIDMTPEYLNRLSNWIVEARYPGEWQEPTAQDAEEALALAQHVFGLIEEEFRRQGVIA